MLRSCISFNTIISIPLSQNAGSEEYWVLSLHIVKRNTQTTAYLALQLRETFPNSAKFLPLWRHVGFVIKSIDVTLANHVIFWPRETVTLLKANLHYFHREKSTFEKFDAGLKLRIVFYTYKTIKNRRKNFRVIYTLNIFLRQCLIGCQHLVVWIVFVAICMNKGVAN